MTENLLLKLEEKTMILLSEVEDLRKQVQFISQENTALKMEKETHSRKLQDLIGLLDTVQVSDNAGFASSAQVAKPMLVQG